MNSLAIIADYVIVGLGVRIDLQGLGFLWRERYLENLEGLDLGWILPVLWSKSEKLEGGGGGGVRELCSVE